MKCNYQHVVAMSGNALIAFHTCWLCHLISQKLCNLYIGTLVGNCSLQVEPNYLNAAVADTQVLLLATVVKGLVSLSSRFSRRTKDETQCVATGWPSNHIKFYHTLLKVRKPSKEVHDHFTKRNLTSDQKYTSKQEWDFTNMRKFAMKCHAKYFSSKLL